MPKEPPDLLKIVVDTNIVFSAILNIDSRIARILIYYNNEFEFHSCDFLKLEIMQHKNRIMKITGYSEDEFYELEYLVTKNIRFMNHLVIEEKIIATAEARLSDVDIDDAPFIALTDYLKAKLWTGDKKLQNGLNKKGYKQIITTEQLLDKIKR